METGRSFLPANEAAAALHALPDDGRLPEYQHQHFPGAQAVVRAVPPFI